MKLDRNIPENKGRGKYALVNLRKNTIEWGDTLGAAFFVIKLQDRHASAGLVGYARSVRHQAKELRAEADRRKSEGDEDGGEVARLSAEAESLEEWAAEIYHLATQCGGRSPD